MCPIDASARRAQNSVKAAGEPHQDQQAAGPLEAALHDVLVQAQSCEWAIPCRATAVPQAAEAAAGQARSSQATSAFTVALDSSAL